jgi:hypothetical protein
VKRPATPSDAFDPEALRLDGVSVDALVRAPSKRPPRHLPGGGFLKGPIPLGWLLAAGRLPHRALHVGLLIWLEAGIRRNRTVTFCLARGEAMGLGAATTRRALRQLAAAGLVCIDRRPGRGLVVTLLDAPAAAGGQPRSAPTA